MALIKCKECGKEVSDSAKNCPHCGVKLQFGFLAKLVFIVIGLFLFFMILGAIGSNNNSAKVAKNPSDYVLSICRDFIKDAAHDRSSVEFERDYPNPIETAPNIYSITVYYRAKNGFGAMRKTGSKCTVKYSGGSFNLIGLDEIK